MRPLILLLLMWLAAPVVAQESVRDLDQPGEHHKHLTTDTVDRWLFDARAEEIIRVDVSSSDFDPVISLVRRGADRAVVEVIVAEVDDPGSRSHMLARLQVDGSYSILVHGPGHRGGGNYRLYVERLSSIPLPDARSWAEGTLDEEGYGHVRFAAAKGDSVAVSGRGFAELIGPSGRVLDGWAGCFDVARDGDHYARVRGSKGSRFRVEIRSARRRPLADAANHQEALPSQGLDEWVFRGHAGDFRTLVVEGDGLLVRVVPRSDEPAAGLERRPPLRWLPSHSKGLSRRFAFVLGREAGYRVQVRSTSSRDNSYRMVFGDSGIAIQPGPARNSALPVGGDAFYTFASKPGQVLRLDLQSADFDPLLRLSDAQGAPLGENDDGGGGLASQYGWLVTQGGLVRAQVAAFGNGGGGDYRLVLSDVPVPLLEVGQPRTSALGSGAVEYWHVEAKRGQVLWLAARSSAADLGLALFDPTGVQVGSDRGTGADRGALLALRMPRDGRYTLSVGCVSGQGAYQVQVLDPDGGR